jgi:predicted ATPase
VRLVSVELQGFRRFAQPVKMTVDGRVVAIVGPNEAGKSSVLEALDSLRDVSPFESGQLTRGRAASSDWTVRARHLVESEDRSNLKDIPGADTIRWYVEYKAADGGRFHYVEPALKRDRTQREKTVGLLRRIVDHRVMSDAEGPLAEQGQRARDLADTITAVGETMSEEVLAALTELASQWKSLELPEDAPAYMTGLPDALRALGEHEALEHPQTAAAVVLEPRAARCILFGAANRDLRSDYDLADVAADPPAALAGLAQLSGLDLAGLWQSVSSEDWPGAELAIERANERLKEAFATAWHQSGVFVRLGRDNNLLRIFISASDGGYTLIAERSDGLRAFLALLVFTALHAGERPPVLLVDEAEMHLHYEAQADLIRVFTRQRAASKIIYTTHSAGCLPQDLASVRTVIPNDDGTSRIRDHFWSEGPGLAPLLIGMGASVLAFTPARFAVFGEGADLLLLPSLLRQATQRVSLDFQVLPGLAEVSPAQVPALELEAGRVAHVVDGNGGGAKSEKS